MLHFSIQMRFQDGSRKGLRCGGCEMTISCSDYPRIILGSWSNRLCIGGSNSGSFRCNLELKSS